MKIVRITVVLEIECQDPADALQAVNAALDAGEPQTTINCALEDYGENRGRVEHVIVRFSRAGEDE